jgi:hypothetical protein
MRITKSGNLCIAIPGDGYIFEDEAGQLIEPARLSEDKKILIFGGKFNDIELASIKRDLYHLRIRV